MPYEMANFVTDHTDFSIVTRSGGDIELLKRLIAGGFPVLVEKGYYEADYTGKVAWMGHYLYTTGYDEAAGEFIVQDAYLKPGKDMTRRLPDLYRRLALVQLHLHGDLPSRAGGGSYSPAGSLG